MRSSRPTTSNPAANPLFGDQITVEHFLREYWQKKPLLVRQAFPNVASPLTADELAGLACEHEANARIVIERLGEQHWVVLHGPLQENDFDELPSKNWTLLVTDVEKHVPEARQLIDAFRFIPDWRIDDLMVSFAPEGGSVGPHTDAYDVFLIQTQGQRRWMINADYDGACLEGTELRILERFVPAEEWVLEPGDMLYLPPNIAHHGVALNDCMTCSVGFRAPSLRTMLSEYAEFIASGIDRDLRYQDPDLQMQTNPAEIGADAVSRIKTMLATQLTFDDRSLMRWLGEFSSEPRSGLHSHQTETRYATYRDFVAALPADAHIAQSPASKFLFGQHDDAALLFVDGNSYTTSPEFAHLLTDHRQIPAQRLLASIKNKADQQTLLTLFNAGSLLLQ